MLEEATMGSEVARGGLSAWRPSPGREDGGWWLEGKLCSVATFMCMRRRFGGEAGADGGRWLVTAVVGMVRGAK
jgi:hypothetical protein